MEDPLGYVIGVLLGDGSLSVYESHYQIRLGATSRRFIDKWGHNINLVTNKRPFVWSYQNRRPNRKLFYHSCISSKEWYTTLKFLKSEFIAGRFPVPNEETKISLVRGFYDSEGSYDPNDLNPKIQISQKDKGRLLIFASILEKLGIHPSGIYQSTRAWNLVIAKGSEILKFQTIIGRKCA